MIDTIKFRIDVDHHTYMCMMNSCDVKTVRDDGSLVVFRKNVNLPSYFRSIGFYPDIYHPKQYESDSDLFPMYCEFSLPKQYFDHNLDNIALEDISSCLEVVVIHIRQYFIDNFLGDIPDMSQWKVYKIDLAVNWDYGDYPTALSVFRSINAVTRAKIFKDTTMYLGNSKFYLKQPEFKKHDYHTIKQHLYQRKINDPYLADDCLRRCAGYLRFETRLNRKDIVQFFGNNTLSDVINNKHLFETLLKLRLSLFYGRREIVMMTTSEAFTILTDKYGYEQATKLMGYLRIKHRGMDAIKLIPVLQRSRYNKLLRDAKVDVDVKTKLERWR